MNREEYVKHKIQCFKINIVGINEEIYPAHPHIEWLRKMLWQTQYDLEIYNRELERLEGGAK